VDPQAKFEKKDPGGLFFPLNLFRFFFSPLVYFFFFPRPFFESQKITKFPPNPTQKPKPNPSSNPSRKPKQTQEANQPQHFPGEIFLFLFFFLVLHNKKTHRNNSAARLGVAGQGLILSWILPGGPLFSSVVRFLFSTENLNFPSSK